MSELTLLMLRLAFLVMLWAFVFAIVYALRSDLFGAEGAPPARRGDRRRRSRSHPPAAPAAAPARIDGRRRRRIAGRQAPRHHLRPQRGSGDRPAGRAADHRALQRVRPRHPRRLHLDPPRPPAAVERRLGGPGPRLDQRHVPRREPGERADAGAPQHDRSRSARRASSFGGSAWPRRGKSAAVSHVGKIRSNNQDSGYAGKHLFVVADGMGGHAGGDVASAIAIKRIADVDREFSSRDDAEFALHAALIAANARARRDRVRAQRAHRHGNDRQRHHAGRTTRSRSPTSATPASTCSATASSSRSPADHTFVQRLVDSGRITAEEAAVHPRRSVLMRVLGDVDAAPEIDTAVVDTLPGDRWLAVLRRSQQLRLRREDRSTPFRPIPTRSGCRRPTGEGEPRPGRPRQRDRRARRHRRLGGGSTRPTCERRLCGESSHVRRRQHPPSAPPSHTAAASAEGDQARRQPFRAGVGGLPRTS